MSKEIVEVVIVGSGPSGLAAATELRGLGAGRVVVLEREPEPGGIPRHSFHTGFGVLDLHRVLSGPRYAAHHVRMAERAGVEIRTETAATAWAGPVCLRTTSPRGITEVTARAVVLATGCRERPRAARLVPGNRPQGVLTTGELQQSVYLYRQRVGTRAIVVGAEHVSFSAVLTLVHAGVEVVAMVTEQPRHQSYLPFKLMTATRYGVPILTSKCVTEIYGSRRVEAVEVTDVRSGAAQQIQCDTVVFTGDWIPDHELARLGGLEIDPGTRGPRVDAAQRTSVRGVFAVGNLLHGAETADTAALCGRHVAAFVQAFLDSGWWPDAAPVPIECAEPVRWISPSAVRPGEASLPHGHFILRVSRQLERTRLAVTQEERVLWAKRYRRLRPNVPIHVSGAWIRAIDPAAGPVCVRVGD